MGSLILQLVAILGARLKGVVDTRAVVCAGVTRRVLQRGTAVLIMKLDAVSAPTPIHANSFFLFQLL